MGIVSVWLGDGGNYLELATSMEMRGFVRYVIGERPPEDRLFRLPRGVYWKAEPTVAEELLAAARAAVAELGEPSAQIVVTAGATAWDGLPVLDE